MYIAVAFTFLCVFYTIVGDYFLKLSSADHQPFYQSVFFYCGAVLYGFSAVFAVMSMKVMGLAAIGVFYSIFTVLMLAVMGVVLFGEKLYAREIVGIGFAVTSLLLMSRSA